MPRKPTASAPNLKVIPASSPVRVEPPRPLGAHGAALWQAITRDYEFSDPGSVEVLCQSCAALDRAEECAREIAKDGQMLRTKTGMREHPLLKHELANRAFTVRALSRLGLDLEPLHDRPGRPSGSASPERRD
jgi:hypothetical protein